MDCFVKDSIPSHFSWGSLPGTSVILWKPSSFLPRSPGIPVCLPAAAPQHPWAPDLMLKTFLVMPKRPPRPLVPAFTGAPCLGGDNHFPLLCIEKPDSRKQRRKMYTEKTFYRQKTFSPSMSYADCRNRFLVYVQEETEAPRD